MRNEKDKDGAHRILNCKNARLVLTSVLMMPVESQISLARMRHASCKEIMKLHLMKFLFILRLNLSFCLVIVIELLFHWCSAT